MCTVSSTEEFTLKGDFLTRLASCWHLAWWDEERLLRMHIITADLWRENDRVHHIHAKVEL